MQCIGIHIIYGRLTSGVRLTPIYIYIYIYICSVVVYRLSMVD